MPLRSGKSLGKFGENYACEVIAKKGHKILARNFHSRHGEIDIISEKEGTIYFFEVKTRRTSSLNYPEESITYQKKQRMLKTAYEFLGKQNGLHKPFSGDKSLPVQQASSGAKMPLSLQPQTNSGLPVQTPLSHNPLRFYLFGILLEGQKIKKIECLPIFE